MLKQLKFVFYGVVLSLVFDNSTANTVVVVNVEANRSVAASIINKLQPMYTFVPISDVQLPSGKTKYKFIEYYENIFVYGVQITAYKKSIQKVSAADIGEGVIAVNLESDLATVIPSISKEQALEIANYPVGKGYKYNIKLIIKFYNNIAKLTYLLDYYVTEPTPDRRFFIIDAHTGEVLEQWDGVPYL
jgi:vibriolysin